MSKTVQFVPNKYDIRREHNINNHIINVLPQLNDVDEYSNSIILFIKYYIISVKW